MSKPDTDWPENLIIATIADAVRATDPDLYETFVKKLLQNKKFLAPPPSGPILSLESIQDVLTEIQHLVRYSEFNRSIPQRRVMIGLLITTLLRRTEWRQTDGIKEFFLTGQKDPNISMYVKRIQNHLRKCLRIPRPTGVRIQILDAKARGRGYEVRFYDPDDQDLLEPSFGIPPMQLEIPIYSRSGYHAQIVLGVADGLAVQVFTRTGKSLLDDELSWTILEQASRKALLSISLLHPADADRDERTHIERNCRRLRDRISRFKNACVSISLTFHPVIAHHLEITQIGLNRLLVGRGETFEEIHASRALFQAMLALLPPTVTAPSELEECALDERHPE